MSLKNKICLVCFDNFIDGKPQPGLPTFDELIQALYFSLINLGYEVTFKKNDLNTDALNILVASHRLFHSFEKIEFKGEFVVLNFEQLSRDYAKLYSAKKDQIRFENYHNFLEKNYVIDYSESNKKILKNNVIRFKLGFFDFGFKPEKKSENSYLFYGAVTEHRANILTSLKDKYSLEILQNVWGFERDYKLSKTHAVLNIQKKQEKTPLEVYRLWHALCFGNVIFSEKGSDESLYKDYLPYVTFTDDFNSVNLEIDESKINRAQKFKEETSFSSNLNQILKALL